MSIAKDSALEGITCGDGGPFGAAIMKDGKLIVIEGACDGIGKTTQFELLKNVLKKRLYNPISN